MYICMYACTSKYSSIEGKVDAVTFATGTGGTLAGTYVLMYIHVLLYVCVMYQKLVNSKRA